MNSILFLLLFPSEDYLMQANFETALRYYKLASQISPSYENSYGLAIGTLAQGEYRKSRELFERTQIGKNEAQYYLGIIAYRSGDLENAKQYFESFHRKNRIWQADFYLSLVNIRKNEIALGLDYLKTTPKSAIKDWLINYLEDYEQLVAAREVFQQGTYGAAIELYKEVENFSGFKDFGLALCHAKTGEYNKSLALFDTIITNSDDELLTTKSLHEAAKLYFQRKNYLKARQYVTRYLQIKTSSDVQFLLGQIYSSEAKYDSAMISFESLPDSIDEYLFFKARTSYLLGLWGKAEEQLMRHREIFPNSVYGDRAIRILALINYRRKEYTQAIACWTDLLAYFPNSSFVATAMKGIGDSYFGLKNYEQAFEAYLKVNEYQPAADILEETKLKIYETSYYLGKYPSLVTALKSYVGANPKSSLTAKVRLRIAKVMAEQNELYGSLTELDRLIEDYPDSAITNDALVERTHVCEKLGDRKEMINSLLGLLAKKKTSEYYSYAANELGVIYLKESRYDSALYYYNILQDFQKYRDRALLEIAKIYDHLGQSSASELMIDKLIAEFPTSVFLFDAYVLKAKAYKKKGDYQSAIELLNEVIQKLGPKPEFYIEIGNLYFELEDYPSARANYLLASERFEQNRDEAAKALILAGDATIAIGDKRGAQDYYLQANLVAKSVTLKSQATAKLSKITED